MNLLEELNEMQQKAVLSTAGPLLILAGAGSGKTRTIIHRIAYILQNTNTKPYEILALTFTNKAAGEMKERIKTFGIPNIDEMWMGTFHSICARMLRMHGDKIGFGSNFTIYDESDVKNLIIKIIDELELDSKKISAASVREVISKAKDDAISAEDFDETYGDEPRYESVGRIYTTYQKKLKENNAMDFDDLLFNTIILFKQNPEILELFQNRFKYILIDEYQDTNRLQYEITYMLAQKHKNICVCGDDDQSIYGWRGADIRNIMEFEKDYPKSNVIRLEQNYRSTGNILQAANEIIENNLSRKGKKLWTTEAPGEKLHLFATQRDLEEADIIAKQIADLKDSGRQYGEVAVLYRMNAQSRILEESLMRRDIPYQIVGGTRFYDRLEIKDILAYLKFAANNKDTIAFARAVASPKRGIGTATIDKINDYAHFKNISILDACLNAEAIPSISAKMGTKLKKFGELIIDIYDECLHHSLHDGVKKAVTESGYIEVLQNGKLDNKESRIENLHELINAAEEFEETSDDASLEAFLENASLIAGTDSMREDEGQVLLMTMHNSKGLEFNVVFIPGMEEGIFPVSRSMDDVTKLEEERRLCYVAITRAREMLYLSYAQYRKMYGSGEYRQRSRFIEELPEELVITHVHEPKVEQKTTTTKTVVKTPKILKEATKNPELEAKTFNVGDTIDHPAWGKGTIVSMDNSDDDAIITAAFAGLGVKKFILGYAKIKKL